MKFRTKARALAVVLIAGLMLTLTATTASADTWHRHYYANHFKGFLKCIARGEQVIGHRNRDQAIYGAISYVCYKAPRQTRHSMDILFEDHESGGGGGGGGGGSWIIVR